MDRNIYRSSFGRSGHLGAIYDIRSDTFQGDTIFNKKLGDDDIYLTELGNTNVELVISDKLEDKFHQLNVETELAVSILSGLVKVSGSGKYLDEYRKSAKTSSMSLIYKVTTIAEEIYLRQLKETIDLNTLNTIDATHVLTGVDWGAVCTITAEYEAIDEDERKEIEENLHAELNKLKDALDSSANTKVDFKNTLKGKREHFRFILKSDIGNSGQDLPVTFEEAVNQAKFLPTSVKGTNAGKGVPLKFTLTPLSLVKKWFKQENVANVLYTSIKEENLKNVVDVVQKMTETKQRLTDIQYVFKKGSSCIPDNEIQKVNDLLRNFGTEEAKFKDSLQVILKDIRSAEKDVSELNKLTNELLNSTFSPENLDELMQSFKLTLNKITEVQKLENSGIQYFGKKNIIDLNAKNEVYIYYTEDLLNKCDTSSFFAKLQKTWKKDATNILFGIVDLLLYAFPKGQKDVIRNKIVHYKSGKIFRTDVMAHMGGNVSLCQIKFNGGKLSNRIPNNRAQVSLRCPAVFNEEAECSGNQKHWLCYKCKETIWYGIESKMFYCEKCKMQCQPREATYRCGENSHDLNFLEYPNEFLWDDLYQLRKSKNLNILILGETGVGKSTWINSFANYFYFGSVEEASKHPPVVAIPSQFTYTENGETKNILIGKKDDNESHAIGASNTQGSRTYPFSVGENIINLIDTPGIGDTRGSQQDDKNMDKILSHISCYQDIHAILVLLKPNNARLGIFFKHCIQQLLTHLHKDASKNIIFVFTNTRSTFYEPGETLPVLRKLIADRNMGIDAVKRNMFCYDNEAFRFLACMQNGIHFESDVIQIYETSWRKACDETERLLTYIASLKPHLSSWTLLL